MRYVALLRGINVGGNRLVPMATLRNLLQGLGFEEVSTYLQSGNALFAGSDDQPEVIGEKIENAIQQEFGFAVTVMLRTKGELEQVVARNPFSDAAVSPTYLHASFLSNQPDSSNVDKVNPEQFHPDEFRVGDRVIYFWYPNGAGRSKMSAGVFEKQLQVRATSRNWNTVKALIDRL